MDLPWSGHEPAMHLPSTCARHATGRVAADLILTQPLAAQPDDFGQALDLLRSSGHKSSWDD
jgi:hypothetical protein